MPFICLSELANVRNVYFTPFVHNKMTCIDKKWQKWHKVTNLRIMSTIFTKKSYGKHFSKSDRMLRLIERN